MINQMSINGVVNCAVTMNGYLYIAGNFNAINGITYYNFAEINLATGNLTSFIPRFDNPITTMAACDSGYEYKILIIGGSFLNVNGRTNAYITAMNQTSYAFTSVISSLGLTNFLSSNSSPVPAITNIEFHTNSGFAFVSGSFYCKQGSNTVYGMLIFNAFSLQPIFNSGLQSILYDDFDIDQVNNIMFFTANQGSVYGSWNISNINAIVASGWLPRTVINLQVHGTASIFYANGKVFISSTNYNSGFAQFNTNQGSFYGLIATNSSTGALDANNWQISLTTANAISLVNQVSYANGNYYVFGTFNNAPIASIADVSSPRSSIFVRNGSTFLFTGDNIFMNGPVVSSSSLTNTPAIINCAIFDANKLHVFGSIPWVDGIPYGGHYIMNADGTRIQQRMLLAH